MRRPISLFVFEIIMPNNLNCLNGELIWSLKGCFFLNAKLFFAMISPKPNFFKKKVPLPNGGVLSEI